MDTQFKTSVAIADDYPLVRAGLIQVLIQLETYQVVIEAADGNELIHALGTAPVLPHLIILDADMPVLNGYDTQTIIRQNWPGIKTLIFAMFGNEMNAMRFFKNGANGYITKGSNIQQIKDALEIIAGGGFYYLGNITNKIDGMKRDEKYKIPEISDKEKQLLQYCSTDLTYKEISVKMGVTPKCIDGYRDNLFRKLKVNNRVSLAIYAIMLGFSDFRY